MTVAVAEDDALEVGSFVQEGGEEVLVTKGTAVGGGAVGGDGEGLGKFGVFPGGGVDEPA
jgi:hypothetical protein